MSDKPAAKKYSGPDRRRKRHLDWDIRGVLALFAITFTFVLAILQVVVAWQTGRFLTIDTLSKAAEVPAWVAGLVASVVGFYFGGARRNGS